LPRRENGWPQTDNDLKKLAPKKVAGSWGKAKVMAKNLGLSVPTLYRWILALDRES
jgi:hypothetical protein